MLSHIVLEESMMQVSFGLTTATGVECNLKAPFSIATTPRCWEGLTPFPESFHSTLDPYLLMLSESKAALSTMF